MARPQDPQSFICALKSAGTSSSSRNCERERSPLTLATGADSRTATPADEPGELARVAGGEPGSGWVALATGDGDRDREGERAREAAVRCSAVYEMAVPLAESEEKAGLALTQAGCFSRLSYAAT